MDSEPDRSSPENFQDELARDQSEPEEELDRNDPRVKRLVDQIMREERDKSAKKGNNQVRDRTLIPRRNGNVSKRKSDKNELKSPSDATLYAPALCKGVNTTPTGIANRHLPVLGNGQSVANVVSNFVEKL